MEYFTLSNGVRMPAVGIGTFLMQPDQAEQAVLTALQMGYKMIDTANAYMNERAVGRATNFVEVGEFVDVLAALEAEMFKQVEGRRLGENRRGEFFLLRNDVVREVRFVHGD